MKIDKKSWQEGYEEGLRKQESQPENTEVVSWYAGFLEGRAEAEMKIKTHKKQLRRKKS
ncbi:hypothetical protein [Desulfobacter hydrogenophilus]|uniref:hypothetical protein n=1 Tax=Desulfobacter hydrogenophilus TaxID=2291 RepID=UPI0013EFB895|nr:hypothetical protein [Desulfobacter hydrogenophilus]